MAMSYSFCKVVVEENSGVKCSGCDSLFHASCAGRCLTDLTGIYSCCAKSVTDSSSHTLQDSLVDEDDAGFTSAPTSPSMENQDLFNVQRRLIHETVTAALDKGLAKIQRNLSALSRKFTSVENKLDKQAIEVSKCKADIVSIDRRLVLLESNASECTNNAATAQSSSQALAPNLSSITSELQDRISRANNLIIYNLPVNTQMDDLELIRSTLCKIVNLNFNKVSIRRFTKPTSVNDILPIVVTFSSPQEVQRVLRNKKLIPKEVVVTADLTPGQRKQFKQLKSLVDKHNKKNPHKLKFVKFVKGNPTIVDSQSDATKSKSNQARARPCNQSNSDDD